MLRLSNFPGIILIFLLNAYVSAQELYIPNNFKKYTNQDGLSSPLVRAIIQDNNGYIWIGTEDGLNKFDGYQFKTYGLDATDTNSLPDNIITCLSTSSDGGIYVGTLNGGFAKYNPDKDNFTAYSAIYGQSGALQHNSIGPVYEDSKGNVWIGSMGGSLYLQPAGADTFKLYEHVPNDPTTLGNNIVVDILEDSRENIWVRTNAGLSKINIETKNITNYNIPRPITEFHLRYTEDMIIDKDEIIWMGWNSEIVKFNTKNASIEYFVPKNLPRDFGFVSSICEHDDNHLWIGSWEAIYLYNKKQNTAKPYYHDPLKLESIPLANNEAIFKDNTGVLWCSGLAKLNLNNKNIQHITNQSIGIKVQDNIIRSLFVDSKGKYWVSTDLGVDIIDPISKTTKSYPIRQDNPSYFLNGNISVFGEDNQGNMWLGHWGQGIVVLRNGDPNDFYRILPQPGVADALQYGNIQAILQDNNGFMWLGFDNGIMVMDVTTLKTRTFINVVEDTNTPTPFSVEPKSIAKDEYGHVWIGMWGGLTQATMLNPEQGLMNSEFQFKQYISEPGNFSTLSDSRTVSILYDKKHYPDVLFSGTYGGGVNAIYKSSSGEFDSIVYITTNDGLPNNTIFGMLTDKNGYIWASTNLGICQFNPHKNEYHTYNKNDGFQGNNFLRSAYAKDDENLLFGGANGLNIFNPDNIGEDKTPPMLVFTDLEIDGKKVKSGQKVNKRIILEKNINNTKKLELTYKEKTFTISFSALHYAFPANNTYKYILEGFDDEWLTVDANVRRASYSNLKPGDYIFKVIASNYDEVPMQAPREIIISIRRPWWKTIPFYIIVVIIISLSIRQIILNREKRVKRDKEILEEELKAGELEIETQKKAVVTQTEELKRRDIEERDQKWFNQGMLVVGDVITKNKNDIKKLSQTFLKELINYLEAIQGVIYLLNDDNESEKFLELLQAYNLPKQKLEHNRIEIGENLIGVCFKNNKPQLLDDIPKNYTSVSSGIGSTTPKQILIMPLVFDENPIGVIELASLNSFNDNSINWINKICEMYSSNIFTLKMNIKTTKIVERMQQQAEEMHAQDEELRQNMEEIKATNEESVRREEELKKLNEEIVQKERKLLKSIKEKDEALKKAHDIIQRGKSRKK